VIAPRPSSSIAYLVLLILVVAAIVVLFRWSERLEESPGTEAVRSAPPFQREPPYRDDPPYRDAPPPADDVPALAPDADRFTFTPYTVSPRCVARCATQDVLRHLPDNLPNSRVCRTRIGLHIDTKGRVTETDILEGSGNELCDRAVETWAQTTRWTTAYNEDVPVPVWILELVEIMPE
jgi:hypothetical protein